MRFAQSRPISSQHRLCCCADFLFVLGTLVSFRFLLLLPLCVPPLNFSLSVTDLILSSRMITHHLPAAYFVALSTHETTKQQSANEKLLAELAAEHAKYRSALWS